ncbi:MAG: PAS domain-containing protein [Actinobacteria bacterium]|nr:PAS domain-containing protein [Actinomycetota bacterium]
MVDEKTGLVGGAPGSLAGAVPRVQDGRIRGAAMALRVAGAAVAVALLPLAPDPRWAPEAFGYALALAWLPLTGLVSMIQRRRPGAPVDGAALVLDLGILLVLMLSFDGVAAAVFSAEILLVGYYTYLNGWRLGATAAVLAVAANAVPTLANRPLGMAALSVALSPLWLASAVVLLEVARRERARMTATLGIAQDKTGAILTGVAEAVVVTSPRGRVREMNESAARTFGCDGEAAVGMSCAELLGLRRDIETLDCSGGCALLQASMSGDYDLTVWRPGPSDARQPLLAHASPVIGDGGQVVEVVHSFRDITKLVEADEAKTVFLATASHELKTPLTVIVGYSELMLRQPDLDPRAREQGLKAIHERARQLTGIVNRILLSSRIEAGKVELRTAAADVRDALEEAVANLVGGSTRAVDLSIASELPDALVEADAVRTVLDHLLDNAAKYSPRHAPIALRASSDATSVILEVEDRGIGMTADQVERCFDRFWQAESGDVRRFGGSGIGLYIVQSLTAAMRGEIEVASEPGQGTTFTVRLPRADRMTKPIREEPPAPEPSIIREFMRQVGVAGPGGGT